MSHDFWWGMVCIPAVIAVVAAAGAAIVGLIWASGRWGAGTYKLYPKQMKDRPVTGSIVACAKSTRYLRIPGWHVGHLSNHSRNARQ